MSGTEAQTVCVIGLGNLGGGVARRLTGLGHHVTGFDPAPAAQSTASAAGVVVLPSLSEAVHKADVVITSLPDGPAVRAAWLGPKGAVVNAKPGATLVELSTIGPDTMLEVAQPAEAAGLRVVDAPVSGGPDEAASGRLVLILGGVEEHVRALTWLWDAMGDSAHFAGALGTAKTVKLVNNLITNATVLVSAEAFQVGVAAGVPPDRLFNLLSAMGGGKSHHFQKRFPWAVEGDFRARFSIDLADKDFGLGLALGEWAGVPTPGAAAMRSIYRVAKAEGLGGHDIVGLLQLYQRWTDQPTDETTPRSSRVPGQATIAPEPPPCVAS